MDSNVDSDKNTFLEEKKGYHKEASLEYKKAYNNTQNPTYMDSSNYHSEKSNEDLSWVILLN